MAKKNTSEEDSQRKSTGLFNLALMDSVDDDPYRGLTGMSLAKKKIEIFIDEPVFIGLTTLCILANTITLALDKHPMD